MNDLFFEDEIDFNQYVRSSEIIGNGCYLVDDKYVVKRISDDYISKYSYRIDKDRLLKYKDIDIEHIFFPKWLIYIDGKICGYITEYVKGKNGENNSFKEIKIEKLLDAIDSFMKIIKEISNLGIRIVDTYLKNIIFDGDNFNFIDMSECEIDSSDKELLYQDNVINTMYEIFIGLFEDNDSLDSDNSIRSFLDSCGFDRNDLYCDNNLLNPCDTIKIIRLFLENKIGKEIDYFTQVDKYLLEIGFGNMVINEIKNRVK